MSPEDKALLMVVLRGKLSAVKAGLEAGANVNGAPEQPLPPITAAAIIGSADKVKFLLGKGTDPDRPVTLEMPCLETTLGITAPAPGERALHIAARSGYVEIVRLLLNWSSANPNATDNTGLTPLLSACGSQYECVEVVRLLLEAGANPAKGDKNGCIPLHLVALNDDMDLVDMLYAAGAPAALNRYASNGQTPLFVACHQGRERMVSKLLSLGAMQRMPWDDSSTCPLAVAVTKGFEGVVRVLINEGGIAAAGGEKALIEALGLAVQDRQARILRLLLAADGAERRSWWANITFDTTPLLHYGAGFCYPAEVSVLLEAGADEAARDLKGRTPRDIIGLGVGREDGADEAALRAKGLIALDIISRRLGLDSVPRIDRGKKVAIRRMLQRGPAYQARSWAWPSDEEADDAGGSGGGETDAAAAAASAAVLSSPLAAPKPPPVVGVRIFRPEDNSRRSTLFVRLVGR
ncbi:unnamed protein product [Laminaria digitata]